MFIQNLEIFKPGEIEASCFFFIHSKNHWSAKFLFYRPHNVEFGIIFVNNKETKMEGNSKVKNLSWNLNTQFLPNSEHRLGNFVLNAPNERERNPKLKNLFWNLSVQFLLSSWSVKKMKSSVDATFSWMLSIPSTYLVVDKKRNRFFIFWSSCSFIQRFSFRFSFIQLAVSPWLQKITDCNLNLTDL